MGGTLDKASFGDFRAEYAASAVGKGRGDRGGACTLLGPEGPGAVFGPWSNLWAFSGLTCGWGWEGYRPYFENYTVDASIFSMTLWGCVVKDDLKDH